MAMRSIAGLVLLCLLRQDQKLPVPEAADQRKAEAEIRSVFKEDFAKKTREGKRALAARLLAEASDTKNSPTSRYVVLQLSRDLAIEGLDVATIADSIDQLGKLYDVAKPALTGATFTSNTNALKVAALNSAQKYARSPEDYSLLGDAYLKVAEDSLKDKLFDDAQSAAQTAEKYAKQAKATAVVERAGLMVKEIPELKKEDDAFGKAITSKADDPAAKLVKGRYSLFVVGDESAGIENLLGCSDEGLKNVAKLEAAKPVTAEAMSDVAETWVALVGKEEVLLQKRRYQERARFWFGEALKNAGGILKAKIEKRLAELGTGGGAAGGKRLDLLSKIDPVKDEVSGTWKLNGKVLTSPLDSNARIQIPVMPPEEYDLLVTLERKEKGGHPAAGGFYIGLVRQDKHFGVEVDSSCKQSMVHLVGGQQESTNGAIFRGSWLGDGRSHSIVYRLRRAKVEVRVDDKPVLDWTADFSNAYVAPDWAPKDPRLLLIGSCFSSYEIKQLSLVPVTGTVKFIR